MGLIIVTCFVGDSWPDDTASNCVSNICISIYFCIFCCVLLIRVLQGGTTWRMRDARTDSETPTSAWFILFIYLYFFFYFFFFLIFCLPLVRWPLADWLRYIESAPKRAHKAQTQQKHQRQMTKAPGQRRSRGPTTTTIIWLSSYIFLTTKKRYRKYSPSQKLIQNERIISVALPRSTLLPAAAESSLYVLMRRYIDTQCAFSAQITISSPTALSQKQIFKRESGKPLPAVSSIRGVISKSNWYMISP